MDRRLIPSAQAPRAPARGGRRAALVCIVAAVTLFHAEAARELASDWLDFTTAAAEPTRLRVAYVRVLAPEAPPAIAPVVASMRSDGVLSHRPPTPRRGATTPASAPASADDVARPDLTPSIATADAAPASATPLSEPAPAAAPGSPPPATPAATNSDATVAAMTPAADAAAATAGAASSPALVAFSWPASTRVSYVLTGNFRGDVNGQAQVEWIHAGDRYQVNLDLVVGPEFAPLITRRMTSDGTLSPTGLVPDRYDQDTKVVLRDRQRVSVRFEPESVVLADGQRSARPAGVQDTASQFGQLTLLFTTQPALLRAGNTIDVPLALPRRTDHWLYDVQAEETLATPLGPLQAFRLKPRRPDRAPGELLADIWIAPALRYLPVRIRVEQDAATFIDLMIAKPPEMAAS